MNTFAKFAFALSLITLLPAADAAAQWINKPPPPAAKKVTKKAKKVTKKAIEAVDLAAVATAVKKHRGRVVYASTMPTRPWVVYFAAAAPVNQTVSLDEFIRFTVDESGKPGTDGGPGKEKMVTCGDSSPGDQRIKKRAPEESREFPDKLLCLYATKLLSPKELRVVQPPIQLIEDVILPPGDEPLKEWLVREVGMDPRAYGQLLRHELYTLGDVRNTNNKTVTKPTEGVISLRTDSFHQFSLLPEEARLKAIDDEKAEAEAKAKAEAEKNNKKKGVATPWWINLLKLLALWGAAYWLVLRPWKGRFRPNTPKFIAVTGAVMALIGLLYWWAGSLLATLFITLKWAALAAYQAYKKP